MSSISVSGFRVHQWSEYGEREAVVLHREPFRVRWFLTQIVTFVYVLPRNIRAYQEVLDELPRLREFAKQHRRTILPNGFQSGYALLPIYLGSGFPPDLVSDVETKFKKRWCEFSVPSLYDVDEKRLITLKRGSLWGGVYRGFISKTIKSVGEVLSQSSAPGNE